MQQEPKASCQPSVHSMAEVEPRTSPSTGPMHRAVVPHELLTNICWTVRPRAS